MRKINCRAFVDNDIIEGRKAQMYQVLAYRWKPSGNEVELWDDLKPIATLNVKWCEVMWSTGLKDKQGVEIYEGDILAPMSNDYHPKYEGNWKVIYREGAFFGEAIGYPGFVETWLPYWKPDEEIEVIGNIHSNPELLKEE